MLVKFKTFAAFVPADELQFCVGKPLGGKKCQHLVAQQVRMNSAFKPGLICVAADNLLNSPGGIWLIDYLNFHTYDERIESELISWLVERAIEGSLPEELYGKAEQLLKSWHIVLPASSTIERLVDSVSARARNDFFEFITSRLPDDLPEQIDELLEKTGSDGKTVLFHLKEYPPAPSSKSILEYIDHFKLIDGMLGQDFDTGVEPQMQKHLALLAKQYDASALKRCRPAAKKYALAACFLVEIRKTVLDYVVAMHDQFTIDMARKSKNKHDRKLKAGRKRAKLGMALILDATEIMVDSEVPIPKRGGVLFESFSEEQLKVALESCRMFQTLEDRGLTDELSAHYVGLHRYLPQFLTLDFQGSVGSESLIGAINLARNLEANAQRKLPNDAPISFVPAGWRKALIKADGSIDRRIWDISLGLATRDSLRSGDLHLPESRKHVSFWNLVYDEKKWENEKPKAYASLALPSKANDLFTDLRNEYVESLNQAKSALATILSSRSPMERSTSRSPMPSKYLKAQSICALPSNLISDTLGLKISCKKLTTPVPSRESLDH